MGASKANCTVCGKPLLYFDEAQDVRCDVDLLHALSELRSRSMQVPGGSCGYWGCCGAAIGAGQFYSIAVGCTPLKRQEWADSARLVSDIMDAIADIGGPRCCKRTSFVALETAARHIERTTGGAMDVPERITCTFMSGNEQCLRANCPYFPAAD